MPQPSILDARLAEIDQRLRTIQSGLAPGKDAERATRSRRGDADRAADPPAQGPADVLRTLIRDHERLLATARELLASFQAAGRPPVRPPEPDLPISVSAGPFHTTDALRRFERALAALPEVRAVAVREYAGDDRAVVDVHLFAPPIS
ncbi:MAG TPA: hypothetical protein VHX62_18785 [Solirubrobacteraceae bacterium]|jgi:hypothetical protein|nr:hypothetical protein [Solirubrobacteraceae bacterium]